MTDSAKPLVFNLALRPDRARFAHLYHCRTGEQLSAVYWRLFEEVATGWKMDPDVLSWYRRRLAAQLDRLEACCLALGDPRTALHHPATTAHLQAAQVIVEEARNAYALSVGLAVIRGRAAGGRNKERPTWHQEAIDFAKLRKSMGCTDQEVVVRCARRFRKSHSAVRRLLQAEGVIKKYTRVK